MIAELGCWSWGARPITTRTMLTAEEPVSIDSRDSSYDRELVERVWQTAHAIPGNDPAIWRKDEHGAWMNRLAYRDRRSEFGWEIADSGFTLRSFGLAALRPMQWQNYMDFLVASRSSVVTADGLRNARKLI
jgi:hypothetical protein